MHHSFSNLIDRLPFPETASEGIALQKEFVNRLVFEGSLSGANPIAGVDASSLPGTNRIAGAVVVWDKNRDEFVDEATALGEAKFPYIPGLLAFREIPVVLEAFEKLKIMPEAVICDGQGAAHPRKCGIACNLGLYLGTVAVGCGKSRLVGSYEQPGAGKGSSAKLTYRGELVGYVVRTRSNVKPVFVSPGHRCGFDEAVKLVLDCCSRYRLPDPIRAAHNLSGRAIKKTT